MFRFVLPLAFAAITYPAVAQQVVIQQRPEQQRGEVRIQVSVNFFASGRADESEASSVSQENARKIAYERAGKECALLLATVAAECRLESVNVNLNRQFGGQQVEGFNVNSSYAYRIVPKS